MSYGNVGTPRFYIDATCFAHACGMIDDWGNKEMYLLNPTQGAELSITDDNGTIYYDITGLFNTKEPIIPSINYAMVLGHKFNSQGVSFSIKSRDADNTENVYIVDGDVNAYSYNFVNSVSSHTPPTYSGYSIIRTASPTDYFWDGGDVGSQLDSFEWRFRSETSQTVTIGGVSIGWMYDMPFSPDLSLSMSHDYDGVKTTTTKGGATLSNTSWRRPAQWAGINPFQIHSSTSIERNWSPTGRRIWDLSFNYISDSDLEPQYFRGDPQMFQYIAVGGWNGIKNDFYSRVIQGTIGGSLPFIFQPDSDVNDYAIARFDMNSFKRTQVANNVYNIKLKIEESW